MPKLKRISASMFVIILLCFFFPFVTVSCGNTQVAELSGIQLVTGSKVETPEFAGGEEIETVRPNTQALVALAAAGVGLGTSFLKFHRSVLVTAGSGALGTIMLLSLKSGIDKSLLERGAGFAGLAGLRVTYGLGFWGSLLLFIAAAAFNIWLFLDKKDQ
ncbi:MAG: hypothetical protein EA366_11135 [Spirulina sp. DLM2.Bin59]|nr:MAG: hypothetical protein EA366_11135 [Spirulina sp. DLM2.Bin59]